MSRETEHYVAANRYLLNPSSNGKVLLLMYPQVSELILKVQILLFILILYSFSAYQVS